MRVAYFSPMPPEQSGIADYSALLLPALGERLDVTVVRRGRRRAPRGTDVSLYHVGNNPDAHAWIVDALRREPGVVVLHDFVLHHLVAGMTVGRRDGHAYLDAMEHEYGVVGRLLAHGVLDKRIPPLWESRPADFPLASFVLEHATGLIVHSRTVFDLVRASGFTGPVWLVPHPAWPVQQVEPARVAAGPVIGCFGVVNASKRIPELLHATAAVRAEHPDVTLLLVGPTSPGFDLERRLQRVGLSDEGLVREGWADEARLWALMAGADIAVNLRHPTMGETSGSVIRALSLGKPLVVSDVGWFSELPDEVALKVPTDGDELAVLTAALDLLVTRPDVRAAMGAAGVELVRREHELGRVAELYAAALEEAVGGARRRRRECYAMSAKQRRTSGSRGTRPRRGRSPAASPRSSLDNALRRVPAWAWLVAIVVGSAVFRAILGRGIVAPFIMVDEIIWSEVARGLADAGEPLLRDQPDPGYSIVYPLLISPVYALFESLPDAYAALKVLNAVLMSLAAVPAYFLARRVVRDALALLAALLAVALPSLAYTGTVMTENVFYPLFLVVTLVLVLVLERPTTTRVVLLFALLGLAFATRVQAVALLPAILIAPFVLSIFERRGLGSTISRFRSAVRSHGGSRRSCPGDPTRRRALASGPPRRLLAGRRGELRPR